MCIFGRRSSQSFPSVLASVWDSVGIRQDGRTQFGSRFQPCDRFSRRRAQSSGLSNGGTPFGDTRTSIPALGRRRMGRTGALNIYATLLSLPGSPTDSTVQASTALYSHHRATLARPPHDTSSLSYLLLLHLVDTDVPVPHTRKLSRRVTPILLSSPRSPQRLRKRCASHSLNFASTRHLEKKKNSIREKKDGGFVKTQGI